MAYNSEFPHSTQVIQEIGEVSKTEGIRQYQAQKGIILAAIDQRIESWLKQAREGKDVTDFSVSFEVLVLCQVTKDQLREELFSRGWVLDIDEGIVRPFKPLA